MKRTVLKVLMTRALLIVALLLSAGILLGEEPPDWSKRDFAAPPNVVFATALKSIQAQHHEIKSTDEANHTVEFHVGTTAWSWGYNMKLIVTSTDEAHSQVVIGIARSGGKTVSWGSGKKEVLKIFAGIDKELAQKAATK
jgi:hypothetical protein